jgi:hypothetical protein
MEPSSDDSSVEEVVPAVAAGRERTGRRRIYDDDDDDEETEESEAEVVTTQGAKKKPPSNKRATKRRKKKPRQQQDGPAASNAASRELAAAHAAMEEEEEEGSSSEEEGGEDNDDQDALIEQYFKHDGTQKDKKGKSRDVDRCRICSGELKEFPFLGNRKTDGRIAHHQRGNLARHLLVKHGIALGQAATVPAPADIAPPPGQLSLKQFAKMTANEEEEVHQAIVLFCALDNRPFAVVEGRGFQVLLNKATRGRFSIPSRRTIARKCTVMSKQAREMMKAAIKKDTMGGATFTTTFDAWTDRCVRVRAGFCFLCVCACVYACV